MHTLLKVLPVLLFLAPSVPALAADDMAHAKLDIQGVGKVDAAPDMAFITSGVTTQAETARGALDANTEAMNELISVLKAANIADRDIQTSNFSVQPQYVYSDKRDANGYNLPPRIVGYQVSNNVTTRVRDLENLGLILDQSVTVGANTINGVSFAVANTEELYNEARKRAVADAMQKAELYADAASVELGKIMSIAENTGFSGPQPMAARAEYAMADANTVPVQAGELTYEIKVDISWSLAD